MSSKGFVNYLATDDLTILLGLIGATVFLLQNLYKPQPLVHPILLGRQSDTGKVRNPGESAVYRNYATGILGRFPVRPDKDVALLEHLVKPSFDAPRTLWSSRVTNPQLKERIVAFGTGLLRLAKLQPGESNVLLLLNDCVEFLISDLALASHSIPSFTLASAQLLSSVLESHPPSAIITHAFFLPQLMELVYDSNEHSHHTFIVLGNPPPMPPSLIDKVRVLRWDDLEAEGSLSEKIISPVPNSSDVFNVSFYEEAGKIYSAQVTHENITAGVASIKALFPPSSAITTLDTIVSAHSLSTPYGRVVAYSAIFEGASFATLDSTKLYFAEHAVKVDRTDIVSAKQYPIPPPTLFFAKPGHLSAIVSGIEQEAKKSLLYSFARRHKMASMSDGFIARDSLFDRLVFDGARAAVMGESAATLRGVVISGGPIPASEVPPARVALSIPIINLYSHPAVCAPVLASHPLDLQNFPYKSLEEPCHSGPPSVNVEAKIAGVDDDRVEAGIDPEGALLVRGPTVCRIFGPEGNTLEDGESWIRVAPRATVLPNGTFRLL